MRWTAPEEADPPHIAEIGRMWMRSTLGEVDLPMNAAIREHGSAVINWIMEDYRALHGVAWPDEPVRNLSEPEAAIARLAVIPGRLASRYAYAMNYLGLPAAIAPTGLHEGLPVAVQIVGRKFREDMCLDAIEAIERAIGVLAHRYREREGRR